MLAYVPTFWEEFWSLIKSRVLWVEEDMIFFTDAEPSIVGAIPLGQGFLLHAVLGNSKLRRRLYSDVRVFLLSGRQILFFASPQIRSEINWCFKLFKLFQVGLQEKPFGQGAVSLWKFSGSRTIFLLMSQYSRRGCSFSQFSCPPGPRTTWQSLNLSGLFWHLTIPGSWNSKIFAYDDWEESSYVYSIFTPGNTDNHCPIGQFSSSKGIWHFLVSGW